VTPQPDINGTPFVTTSPLTLQRLHTQVYKRHFSL